jgi:alpha-L-rhamnosidase
MLRPDRLSVEYDPHPISVATTNPRFTWKLSSTDRGQKQNAYRILVSSTETLLGKDVGDVWDSGKVASAQCTLVSFAGKALVGDSDYCWKVCVWDAADTESPFSAVARFSTALLDPADWSAQWIGRGPLNESEIKYGPVRNPDRSQPMFRKDFIVARPVRRARAFICGLGFHEMHLNGEKVGNHYLAPSKTDFRLQVLYETLDITNQLVEGDNAVGIMVGGGWYSTQKRHWGWRMKWYGHPRAFCQMHIEYTDGSSETLVTDDTWKSTTGAIITNCIFDGEVYDARLELPGWDVAGYDDTEWDGVNLVEIPAPLMVSSTHPPALAHESIRPVAVTEPQPGMYVFDMGENFTGWVRLRVEGPAGTEVVLKYAEKMFPQDSGLSIAGMIDQTSMSNNRPEDRYILKGDGLEEYEPRFTWHGGQYIEITGFPGVPDLDTIEGRFIHTACRSVGTFDCDNALVNQIHDCAVRSQRGNIQGLPVDCPQRSERLGWLGDAHVTAEEAMMNLDMATLYAKWLRDIKKHQREDGGISQISPRPGFELDTTWSAAYILIPWYMYLNYGDVGILKEHYDSHKLYIQFLSTDGEGCIARPPSHGDHLSVVNGFTKGSPVSMSTAFYYYDALTMSRIANVLGHSGDEQQFTALAADIRSAFNEQYFDDATNTYDDATQTALSIPLLLGMVPDGKEDAVLDSLVNDVVELNNTHLTTGLIGVKYLVDALTAKGRHDLVWQLVNQTGFPSWSDLLKDGRTTFPENWNGEGSINHIVMGSVDAWFYKELAGIQIDPEHPGYERVVIKPFIPDDLTRAAASVDTIRGVVASSWVKDGESLVLDVTIPVNSDGLVYVPSSGGSITEGGKVVWDGNAMKVAPGIVSASNVGDSVVFEVGSGTYSFKS